jgi:hypothetical protein
MGIVLALLNYYSTNAYERWFPLTELALGVLYQHLNFRSQVMMAFILLNEM